MRHLPRIALLTALPALATSCGPEELTFDMGGDCVQAPPRLAGTWAGTLRGQELTLLLTERCEGPVAFADSWKWVARGEWRWGGMSGPVESRPYSSGSVYIILTVEPLLQTRSVVTITSPFMQLPAGTTFTGSVSGRWTAAGDTTRVLAAFEGEAVTLGRR